ncbi:MAG: FAD:protein FMN transferase, partial [Gaiellaceae bacterium]
MSGRVSFRSMGCDVLVAGASPAAVQRIRTLFEHRDDVFSRFRPDSELNRVNAARGEVVRLSPLFASTLRAALDAAEATRGIVDPTLGTALESAGYTADFAGLDPDPRPPGPAAPGSWASLRLAGRLLSRPAGVKLDLNGVVKALAVDDSLELLDGDGFVSAGGDLAARGELDVALPGGGAVRLVRGALATSGSSARAWLRGGRRQHHLIDPHTGRPAESPWEQVTVCGDTCRTADVAAKAAFLLGEAGPDWLDERGLPGWFLTHSG